MKLKCPILFLIFLGINFSIPAQERIITVGGQIKPIFPSRFFGAGPEIKNENGFNYSFEPLSGYAAGMLIRKGYKKNLSVEFGINFVARNYKLSAAKGNEQESAKLRIIGYEIPMSQLVFIRLSERIFMNVSGGLCLNIFPSDVLKNQTNFQFYAGRKQIFRPGLIANMGFEYRSRKSGYYYIGSSLNRPFGSIYAAAADYLQNNKVEHSIRTELKGIYLTLDLRYFFHEDPQKSTKKKKSN